MRGTIVALAIPAVVALAGCATHRTMIDPPNGYLCGIERTVPEGEIHLRRGVNFAGVPGDWSGAWSQRTGTVELQAIWVSSPEIGLGDTQQLNIIIYPIPAGRVARPAMRRIEGYTVEVRRDGKGPVILRRNVYAFNLDSYGTSATVGEIRSLAGGGWIELTVKDWRGRELARGVLDPVMVGRAIPMIDRAKVEIETLRIDARNRCRPAQFMPPIG